MEYTQIGQTRRPRMLTALCISTFIGSGSLIIISILLLFINNVEISDSLMKIAERSACSVEMQALLNIYENAIFIEIVKLCLYILSLIGAIMIFKLNKRGFYLYVFAQISLLFVSPIYNDLLEFPICSIIFVILWVSLYARYLPLMTIRRSCCK